MSLYPFVDEELADYLAEQGIAVIDCRVNPELWAEPGVDDRPVRHDPLREVGRQPRARKRCSGPVLDDATAGTGLGDEVPVPIHPRQGAAVGSGGGSRAESAGNPPASPLSVYDWLMMQPRWRRAAARGVEIARERGEL